MGEFRMPSLGAGMDAGRVLEWRVAPGDEVHRGDVVALVETDKAAIEVEVFEDGVIEDLVVAEDTKVPVGTVLAHIGTAATAATADRAAPEPAPHAPPAARAPVPAPVPAATPVVPRPPPPPAPAPPPTAPARVGGRSSPYARRLAREQGIDLATRTGSGPDGAVVAQDLTAAPGAPAREEDEAQARGLAMRRAIGRAMAQAKQQIPHYYLGQVVDVEDALQWLEARNAGRPATERVLPGALVLAATARACREHPDLNGFWVDDAFRPSPAVHLGVAISLRGGGLIAPAIHDADTRSLDELMQALNDLVRRARVGGLRGSELTDPTITVTSLGDRGVDTVYGIIYPPQVALVGAGRIATRPCVVEDRVVPRRVVHLTLAADHRASDGHRGGLFLDAVARHLQTPEAP